MRLDFQRLVAFESHIGVDSHALFGGGIESASSLRPRPLFLHGGFETVHVHVEPSLTHDIGGQVRRKTEGVVKFEHHLAGNRLAPGSRDVLVEQCHATI